MTPVIKSYVSSNLKLFHNLRRNGQTRLEHVVSFSSDKSDDGIISNGDEPKHKEEQPEKNTNEKKEYPEEPSTCCMSGCANCVWLDYAEKLSEYYKDGGEQAIKEINEKVTDENIKAFLLHELRMRNKK